MQQLPIPPFTHESALIKVQLAEDAWNTRNPKSLVQLVSPSGIWRSRESLFQGRAAIEFFLRNHWAIESGHGLEKELWAFFENRISVRFSCEWRHLKTGQWYRSYGNEHWEFDSDGYMTRRDMSANDIPIDADKRRISR